MPKIIPIPDFFSFIDAIHHLPGFVFLGSTGIGENTGRYCIASALPETQQLLKAGDAIDRCVNGMLEEEQRPRRRQSQKRPETPSPLPFQTGRIGILFYEAGYFLQPLGIQYSVKQGTPLYWIGDFGWSATYDRYTGEGQLYFGCDCPEAIEASIRSYLKASTQTGGPGDFRLGSRFTPDISELEYRRGIDRIQAYLTAGDCYQVNLSQRFQAHFQGVTWPVFKQLCTAQPSPYSAFLKTACGDIISISPEQFLGVQNRHIITRPIKGTRPIGLTESEDIRFANELKASEKDQSENLMIVDLLRNDLGRFCVPGSVEVPELFGLESYANVHHLVSTIRGQLKDGVTPWKVLNGCFPGGSITGAPKIRAMQIIRELEPHLRGPYCGSIFYISDDGRMDSNIAIRTLLAKGDRLYCYGGGGVVMDSDAEAEYQESLVKVQRLMGQIESFGST